MLPVDAIRRSFDTTTGPLVVTAPPGSGKSTRIPLWCDGPVLVVQPRRVAARSLCAHLRDQGHDVGFAVRGESAHRGAPVLFVTPGVALRMLPKERRFRTVVLDEFHERSLDLDLLLALVHDRAELRLIVLSATLDGDRLAEHLGGVHMIAEGRLHPVEVRYTHSARELPDDENLGPRVRKVLASLEDVPGDRLVFVPGRAEIAAVVRALEADGDELIELHGGLSLKQQGRVFSAGTRRRVIVATNVAETSLTLPNIGAVVDSGLVRRTHYHQDRGYLMLGPIASDSAEQRAGRAGRLGPGVAVRMWGERAPLRDFTPPEIQRESLVSFVLAACAAGEPELELPFVDEPPPHAVETARQQLTDLGALDEKGAITSRGRQLFQLPLDAHIAHLLVVAEEHGQLAAAIDLAGALGSNRPLFRKPVDLDDEDDLRNAGCDATALVRAVRRGEVNRNALNSTALADIRRDVKRLREMFGEPEREPWDRLAFARVLVAAWPRCAHVARRRKRSVQWSNGGTEVSLDRRSAVSEEQEAVLALNFRALGRDRLHRELRMTAAMPLTLAEMAELGLGKDRAGRATVEGRRVEVMVERVYAGTILRRTAQTPVGEMARRVLAERLLAGQFWKGFAKRFRARYRWASLEKKLAKEEPLPDEVSFVFAQLCALGLETIDDMAMLEEEDLLPPALPFDIQEKLERDFPDRVELGTARFRVEVVPGRRLVELHNLGARLKKPPSSSWLPSFRGFAVVLVDRGVRKSLRSRSR